MITALVLGAALAAPTLDKWELKAPYGPKTTTTWSVGVDASMPDGKHEAKFKLEIASNDRKEGDAAKATVSWRNLEVDGQEMGDSDSWELDLDDKEGSLKGGDEDIARMLMPMFFLYPKTKVEATDSWGAKFERSKTEAKMSAQVLEKIGEVEVLKVFSDIKETTGTNPMTANGIWWVDKDGNVHKFEVTVKNWVVPMAGGDPVDAVMKGELAKK